jgi:hypothetical protein
MALKKLGFKPGFNKQTTASGAEGEWIDGDFVRFRYGLPEKIGGWSQLTMANKTFLEQREPNTRGQQLVARSTQPLEHTKDYFYFMVMPFMTLHL